MDKHEFLRLLDRYLSGNATEQETRLLMNYYESFQQSPEWNVSELGDSKDVNKRMLLHIRESIRKEQRPLTLSLFNRYWKKASAAAAILLVAAGTYWWFNNSNQTATDSQYASKVRQASGAQYSITLELADGNRIVLDTAADGIVSTAGNTHIRKQGNLLICEQASADASMQSPGYNTLSVARGSQYQVILPDNSKVWLNTYSSLSFPDTFPDDERNVSLAGEGYFEIEKDARRPFKVTTQGSEVEVLGTHFNVNAYGDEKYTRTTLLEGSVRVSHTKDVANTSQVLIPGEQALLTSQEQAISVQKANVDEVMAWRSGLFNFNNADIHTIMREIARWYDVEVIYADNIPARSFSGKINRNIGLASVLTILEQSNIRFRLIKDTVIVTH